MSVWGDSFVGGVGRLASCLPGCHVVLYFLMIGTLASCDTSKYMKFCSKGECTPVSMTDVGEAVVSPIVGLPLSVGSYVASIVPGGDQPSPFQFHGKWCGPGHPAPGTNPEPEDVLDTACQAHDLCYERLGYYNCECDVKLVKAVREEKNMPVELKTKALKMSEYFSNSYCRGCKQTKRKIGSNYVCFDSASGCRMPKSWDHVYAWCPK